jgi:hypothetical protein
VLDGAAHAKAPTTGSILLFDLKGFGARHLNRQCLGALKVFFFYQVFFEPSTVYFFKKKLPSVTSTANVWGPSRYFFLPSFF